MIFQPRKASSGIPGAYDVYILSIGINRYPPGSGIPRLMYAEADASELADALATSLTLPGFPRKAKVVKLLGNDATVSGIREAMQNIAREARPSDILIFNFDGMGACTATGGSYASDRYEFAASDTSMSPNGAFRNPLTSGDLRTLLVQIPANQQYVILDACGSHRALDDLRNALQPPGDALSLFNREVHLVAPDGPSYESSGLKHGHLTAIMLKALAGAADFDHTGAITWNRLIGYCTWKLPETRSPDQATVPEGLYSFTLYGDSEAQAKPNTGKDASTAISTQPTRALTPDPDEASPGANSLGEDFALIVGTDHYVKGWPTLHNAIRDADWIHDELVENYGFRNDPAHLIDLRDATKHQLNEAILSLTKRPFNDRDRLFVYFAGHGYRNQIEGYLVLANSELPSIEEATDSMESFSELSSAIDQVHAGHILLVMDVCYGGRFDGRTRDGKTRFHSMLGTNWDDSASPREAIRRVLEVRSRLYITSGDEDHQVSDGEPGQHSPFSKRLHEVLEQNRNASPFLDISTLYAAMRSIKGREPRAGYFFGSPDDTAADYIFIPKGVLSTMSAVPRSGTIYSRDQPFLTAADHDLANFAR